MEYFFNTATTRTNAVFAILHRHNKTLTEENKQKLTNLSNTYHEEVRILLITTLSQNVLTQIL